MRPSRARCGSCAITAPSRSISTHRIGGNFRLDALQAAVLRVKAPHLAAWSDARRRNADRYRELFAEFGLTDRIDAAGRTGRLSCTSTTSSSSAAPRRDALMAHLRERRIGTEIYYPVPFHRQACFAVHRASLTRRFPSPTRREQVARAAHLRRADGPRSSGTSSGASPSSTRSDETARARARRAGQLGDAMTSRLVPRHEVVARSRDELDVTVPDAVRATVGSICPDVIVNCAAYTNVDAAQREPIRALDTNAWAVHTLARAAADINATLVHFSTDFVFDGTVDRPYDEDRDAESARHLRGVEAARRMVRGRRAAPLRAARREPVRRPAGASSIDRLYEGIVAGRGRPGVRRSHRLAELRGRRRRGDHAAPGQARRHPGSTTASTPAGRRGPTSRGSWPASSARPTRRFSKSRSPTPICRRRGRSSRRCRMPDSLARAWRCRPGRMH